MQEGVMRTPTHDDFSGNLDPLTGDHSNVFGPELGDFDGRDQVTDADVAEAMKTGTTTVGLRTEDGAVMATDMRASLGNMVSSKDVQKVEEIHPTGAMTIAGSVSAAQSLIRSLRAEVRLYESRRGEDMSMTALSTLLSNFLRSGAFLIVVPVLGGVDEEGSHIYSVDALGGMTEENYAVSGSGSQFALGVLEQDYDETLSVEDARTVAIRSVKSAVERDTASGNGINIATVDEGGVEIERHKDIDALL
jgi:proteasome beta subunit